MQVIRKNLALRAKKQELLEHLELLNFLNSMKTAVRSFFSGAQRNDVFSAVAAEFRNETVLYLRLVRELALRRYAVSEGRELKELSRHSGFFIVFVIKHLLPKLQICNYCFRKGNRLAGAWNNKGIHCLPYGRC